MIAIHVWHKSIFIMPIQLVISLYSSFYLFQLTLKLELRSSMSKCESNIRRKKEEMCSFSLFSSRPNEWFAVVSCCACVCFSLFRWRSISWSWINRNDSGDCRIFKGREKEEAKKEHCHLNVMKKKMMAVALCTIWFDWYVVWKRAQMELVCTK